ncbi:hypothetical protein KC960_04425, partial [Candidatus Saccharibacteria bacterium]|nr:hypothetical protein [Candidatus Saccharibacteria bacterium]
MNSIWDFLNSQFFEALITFVVGLAAWYVYKKQRDDTKRDIANSVLSEIQSAERAIERVRDYIRDTEKTDISIRIIGVNSWTEYRHYFSNDLDEDEWAEINSFYNDAILLDEVLRQSNAVFESNAEQIRANMQRILADLTGNMALSTTAENLESSLKNLNDKATLFDQVYQEKMKDFTFTPVKYMNDAKKILEDLK